MNIENEKDDEYFPNIKKVGYMLSEFFYAPTKWMEENRQYPAKVSEQGGHPMLEMAKLAKFKDWSPMWVNTSIAKDFSFDYGKEYLKQEKLDQPFALIDEGYNGQITKAFKDVAGNKKLQTFFLIGTDEAEKNGINVFLNQKKMGKMFSVIKQNPYCFVNLLEAIPRKYNPYYNLDKGDNDKLYVKLQEHDRISLDKYNVFYKGIEEGFQDCQSAVNSGDNEQFVRYLRQIEDLQSTLVCALEDKKSFLKNQKNFIISESYEKTKNIYKTGFEK